MLKQTKVEPCMLLIHLDKAVVVLWKDGYSLRLQFH